MHSI